MAFGAATTPGTVTSSGNWDRLRLGQDGSHGQAGQLETRPSVVVLGQGLIALEADTVLGFVQAGGRS